jgi:threonine/homoserine/homoserine lactone efflux protein
MSEQLLVIPFAYGLGFLAAIPIGASQVEVVKRALAQRYGAALLAAAGSVTSDITYGFVALFGLARFLEHPAFLAGFQWMTACILTVLSMVTWRQSNAVPAPDADTAWAGGGMSYLTGLAVGVSYPPIMLSWLMGFALVKGMRLTESFHPSLAAGFVLSGGAGLFSYMVVLTLVLRRTRRFHTEQTVRLVYRGLSVLLGVIAFALIVGGALRALTAGPVTS